MLDSETQDILIKLALSLGIGLVIGAEREFKNKSAGLRTIALICLGSTLFTIVSIKMAHPTEVARVASNIATGIGFLGAGAILRDGLSVSGLTTASTIWVAAAIGLAVGTGEYSLAIITTVIALIVLTVFSKLQVIFDKVYKVMELRVVFDIDHDGIRNVEEKMRALRIKFERKKEWRKKKNVKYQYELSASVNKLEQLIEYLISQKEKIKEFEY